MGTQKRISIGDATCFLEASPFKVIVLGEGGYPQDRKDTTTKAIAAMKPAAARKSTRTSSHGR